MIIKKNKKVKKESLISESADGTIYVTITKNNTMVTLADKKGDVVTWTSCRNCGFFGGQKTTPMATITTAEEIGLRARDFKIGKVNLVFRGKNRLRNQVMRGLARSRVKIQDLILVPNVGYNGCRPEKKSRK